MARREKFVLTEEQLDALLTWLDPNDRDEAAAHLVKIQNRLIMFFVGRASCEAEHLADMTINVVAKRVHDLSDYQGNKASYFGGVAKHVLQEEGRRARRSSEIDDYIRRFGFEAKVENDADDLHGNEERLHCLDKCIAALTEEDQRLAIEYHRYEKQQKILRRKDIADQLGLSVNALRIRMFRLRTRLFKCIEKCLEELAVN